MPATTVKAGRAYSFKPTAADPDGDALTFSITNRPTWATFNAATGQLAGTPAVASVGTYSNIVISVSDGRRARRCRRSPSASPAAPNQRAGDQRHAGDNRRAGSAYCFQPTAADADGDTLGFSIQNRPDVGDVQQRDGSACRGTPTTASVGSYSNIVISVSDGKTSASLAAFSITVAAAPNKAPTISGTPATAVKAGSAYSFRADRSRWRTETR